MLSQPNTAVDSMRVAVVVPIYIRDARDVQLLQQLLLQLSKQERLAEHIILVDDASPIPVLDILQTNTSAICKNALILRMEQNSGPAAARNTGIFRAQSLACDIICFLDADCAPDPAWVKVMTNAHQLASASTELRAFSGNT